MHFLALMHCGIWMLPCLALSSQTAAQMERRMAHDAPVALCAQLGFLLVALGCCQSHGFSDTRTGNPMRHGLRMQSRPDSGTWCPARSFSSTRPPDLNSPHCNLGWAGQAPQP